MRLATSDMKLPANEDTQTRGESPFYVDEVAVNDYYPFGMLVKERSWSSSDYRYGYNGQERSLDIDANGNHNTAEFWKYDARSGRRWNRDPVIHEYESPYTVLGDSPILFLDSNGVELRAKSDMPVDNSTFRIDIIKPIEK